MATPDPKTEQSFDDAFTEALAADVKGVEGEVANVTGSTAQDPPGGEAEPPAGDAGAADTGAAEGTGAEGAAAEGEAAAAAVEAAAAGAADKGAAPAVPAAPATPAAAGAETPEQELARLRAENAALAKINDRFAPAAEPAAPAASAAAAVPAEPKWYEPKPEEVERVTAFAKEWPDIHEAVQTLLKQAGYNAAEYVFHTVAKVYNPTLQEFAKLSETIQEQLALGALRSEHKDYDEVYDHVVAWVDTLSPAFKRGAKQVMESGTPEEVNDLISAYKETDAYKQQVAAGGGAIKAATPAAAVGAPAPSTTGLSAAAKKAAGKLQVVGSRRTTPVAPAAADDFDGAWAEAMRSG